MYYFTHDIKQNNDFILIFNEGTDISPSSPR